MAICSCSDNRAPLPKSIVYQPDEDLWLIRQGPERVVYDELPGEIPVFTVSPDGEVPGFVPRESPVDMSPEKPRVRVPVQVRIERGEWVIETARLHVDDGQINPGQSRDVYVRYHAHSRLYSVGVSGVLYPVD